MVEDTSWIHGKDEVESSFTVSRVKYVTGQRLSNECNTASRSYEAGKEAERKEAEFWKQQRKAVLPSLPRLSVFSSRVFLTEEGGEQDSSVT